MLTDRLENRGQFRMLVVIDEFTRECLAIDAISSSGEIWVMASLNNFSHHMIIDLPTESSSKEPEVPVSKLRLFFFCLNVRRRKENL